MNRYGVEKGDECVEIETTYSLLWFTWKDSGNFDLKVGNSSVVWEKVIEKSFSHVHMTHIGKPIFTYPQS